MVMSFPAGRPGDCGTRLPTRLPDAVKGSLKDGDVVFQPARPGDCGTRLPRPRWMPLGVRDPLTTQLLLHRAAVNLFCGEGGAKEHAPCRSGAEHQHHEHDRDYRENRQRQMLSPEVAQAFCKRESETLQAGAGN
jgi:hypothetical protein